MALAHGLNANLVRKWRHGRGLKRSGLATTVAPVPAAVAATLEAVAAPSLFAAPASFLPVEMIRTTPAAPGTASSAQPAAPCGATIDIELKRGAASLGVRWPVSAAGDCVAWLREVTAGLVR